MVGREFRGREEVKKKTSTGREDVHPQNRLNGLSSTGALVAAGFVILKLNFETLI